LSRRVAALAYPAAEKARRPRALAPVDAVPLPRAAPAQAPPRLLRPAPRQSGLAEWLFRPIGIPRTLRMSTFGVAVTISIVVHAVALSLHFTLGSGRIHDRNPPLEVALVNAKSATKPVKADLLAQANLDGGGNTEQDRRAKTPLPALKPTPRRDIAVAAAREEVMDNTTKEMLTQLRDPTAIPTPEPKPLSDAEPTSSPTANDLMEKMQEAMRLEAKIARDMDAYQKIPRRKSIGSQAREYRFARYVESWRSKVERVGNDNYPLVARQNRLYGSVVLTVSIRADGSVEDVEVNHRSKHRVLDAAAVKIVKMAGPYAPFPDDIRRDTDIISITRTFTFARGDELHSE
jgi:protein TonB